jgi:hypothetical protein
MKTKYKIVRFEKGTVRLWHRSITWHCYSIKNERLGMVVYREDQGFLFNPVEPEDQRQIKRAYNAQELIDIANFIKQINALSVECA